MIRNIIDYYTNKILDWDSICKKCGICCHDRDKKKGRLIVNYDMPCEYIDVESNTCIIYKNRFKICRECKKVTIIHALFSRYLPKTCGYVMRFRNKKKK